MSPKNTNMPIKTIRCRNIRGSVWRNEVKRNGRAIAQYSVRIHKRFKNRDGNYQTTEYLFVDDLPRVCFVAQELFRFVSLTESKDAKEEVPA
jgi:hypothetical protein